MRPSVFFSAVFVVFLVCPTVAADPSPDDQSARIRSLIRDLGAESWETRDRASRALRKLGPAARPLLEEALKGPDLEIRRAAATLLRRGAEAGDGALPLRLRTRKGDFGKTDLFKELVARGADVVPVLLDIIRAQARSETRYDYYCLRNAYAVIRVLAENKVLGPDQIPVILDLMDSPNIQTRLLGHPVLKALAGEGLLDLLGERYGAGGSAHLKGHLLHLMESEKRGSTVALLPEALRDDDSPLRLAAVQLISRRRDDKHLVMLIAASADDDPAVRSAILQGLQGYAENRDARRIIRLALEDPEPDVRRAALYAASSVLRRSPDRSFIPGSPLLREREPDVVRAAAQLLGNARDRGATPLLVALLRSEDQAFRSQIVISVVQALGQVADPIAEGPLETYFRESINQGNASTQASRVYAVQALLRISGEKAIPFAEEVMTGDETIAPQILLQTLLEVPGSAKIPLLRRGLDSENTFVAARAAQGLGQVGFVEAAPKIAELLENENSYLRQCVLEALGALGSGKTAPTVLSLLDELLPEDGNLQPANLHHARLAITALGTARHTPAISRLAEIVRSGERLSQDAARALSLIGGDEALAAIHDALRTALPLSRDFRALASCLARLGDVKAVSKLHEADRATLDASDSPQPMLLALAADSAIRSGRKQRAVDLGKRRADLEPDEANAHYDLGCILALAGEVDMALEALEQARIKGYRRIRDMLVEPDLESLRKTRHFRDIVARMNRR